MLNPLTDLQNQIILSQIPLSQIFDGLREIIREEIKAEKSAEAVNALISSTEARKLFYPELSKSTLYRWCKGGLINKKRIGGKVVFLKSEIEEAAKTLKLYNKKAG
jgi:hypothetical protein